MCRVSGPNHRSFFESFAILIILYIYIYIYIYIYYFFIYYYLFLFIIIYYYLLLYHIMSYYIILYDFCAGQISTKCFFPIHRVLFVGPQGLFISVGWLKHWKIYRKKTRCPVGFVIFPYKSITYSIL